MPFPSAHPAAVLPLRRFCPRFFIFPALVIGSLIPDFSYVFHSEKIAGFAHHLSGGVCLDLPLGLIAVLVFYAVRLPAVRLLPAAHREVFLPLCRHARGAWRAIAVSLMIGICTHLFLDAATHRDGWFFVHLRFLEMPLFRIGRHLLRTSDLLWFLFTYFGTAWLGIAYLNWLARVTLSATLASASRRIAYGALFGLLVFPFPVMHKLLNSYFGIYPVSACTLLVAAAFALIMVKVSPPSRQAKSNLSRQAC